MRVALLLLIKFLNHVKIRCPVRLSWYLLRQSSVDRINNVFILLLVLVLLLFGQYRFDRPMKVAIVNEGGSAAKQAKISMLHNEIS